MYIGKRLKFFRGTTGYPIYYIAQQIMRTDVFYRKMEQDLEEVTPAEINKLARFYGVTREFLINDERPLNKIEIPMIHKSRLKDILALINAVHTIEVYREVKAEICDPGHPIEFYDEHMTIRTLKSGRPCNTVDSEWLNAEVKSIFPATNGHLVVYLETSVGVGDKGIPIPDGTSGASSEDSLGCFTND